MPNDGKYLEKAGERAQTIRECGERSRAGVPLGRSRRRIDDDCGQKPECAVRERRVPGTQLAEPEVMPPEDDERAGIPDQTENRGKERNAARRHGSAAPGTAPDHHREHAVKGDARGESDEMD